jgi:hypothetical protein
MDLSITVINTVTHVTVGTGVITLPWSPHFGSTAVSPYLTSPCIHRVISDCGKLKYKFGDVLLLHYVRTKCQYNL